VLGRRPWIRDCVASRLVYADETLLLIKTSYKWVRGGWNSFTSHMARVGACQTLDVAGKPR